MRLESKLFIVKASGAFAAPLVSSPLTHLRTFLDCPFARLLGLEHLFESRTVTVAPNSKPRIRARQNSYYDDGTVVAPRLPGPSCACQYLPLPVWL